MNIDQKKIYPEEISSIFRLAQEKKYFDESENQSAIFFNLEKIQERIQDLKNAFPEDTLHAVAIKTNPLSKILSLLNNYGAGGEAASYPEVILAIDAGISPDKIVFDSPAKTENDLHESMDLGIHINIDNFTEAKIIDKLLNERKTKSTFGLRINPQTGSGNIASMSTSGQYSKFGIPITEYRHEIINCFQQYEWLSGLHVHSGSQGLNISQMVSGVRKIYDLAEEINNKFRTQKDDQVVKLIDIGGGFPISYHSEIESPDIREYALQLENSCPNLFSGYRLITEFGRFIYGHSGWVASRIEYIKKQEKFTTAIIHVGADLFLRECYNPEDWYHEFS
ncbi:MAG: diaminopimelate decarboxylase, partial [Candidatus Marinimicrobia bacterium]|nr:diaminopimelate decarboxylase [Candidatus Neomarinimicrobiota bacterium]